MSVPQSKFYNLAYEGDIGKEHLLATLTPPYFDGIKVFNDGERPLQGLTDLSEIFQEEDIAKRIEASFTPEASDWYIAALVRVVVIGQSLVKAKMVLQKEQNRSIEPGDDEDAIVLSIEGLLCGHPVYHNFVFRVVDVQDGPLSKYEELAVSRV